MDKDKQLAALAALSKLDEETELDWSWPKDQVIDGLKLVCTCVACPEQYDVFDEDKLPEDQMA